MTDASLVNKVYFPRLILPLSATLAPLVDFAITLIILFGMLPFFGVLPTWRLLTLPLFLLLAVASVMAFGLWLAALNVRYRDVGNVLPFLLQLWMYASPVAYPMEMVPARWRLLYALNPMASVIAGFRWALLDRGGIGRTRPQSASPSSWCCWRAASPTSGRPKRPSWTYSDGSPGHPRRRDLEAIHDRLGGTAAR